MTEDHAPFDVLPPCAVVTAAALIRRYELAAKSAERDPKRADLAPLLRERAAEIWRAAK